MESRDQRAPRSPAEDRHEAQHEQLCQARYIVRRQDLVQHFRRQRCEACRFILARELDLVSWPSSVAGRGPARIKNGLGR